MKSQTWILIVALLIPLPAAAEMWRYTDETGATQFTNDFSSIPLQLRGSAKRHALKTNEEIAAARRASIEAYTAEEAKLAVEAGGLTEDEVRYLMTEGALRATEMGDAYRFAMTPKQLEQKKHAEMAAQATAAAAAGAFDGINAAQMQEVSGGQLGQIKKFGARLQASPNFRYSLYGEAILFVLMIVGLPFVLRNYHDDGTRRIIRASFFFSFIILSATMNILLFKNEIVEALNLGASLQSNPSPGAPPPVQPAQLR